MAILSLDWYVWVALALLFLYALVRRLVRSWQYKRGTARPRPSWASRAGHLYGSKRP